MNTKTLCLLMLSLITFFQCGNVNKKTEHTFNDFFELSNSIYGAINHYYSHVLEYPSSFNSLYNYMKANGYDTLAIKLIGLENFKVLPDPQHSLFRVYCKHKRINDFFGFNVIEYYETTDEYTIYEDYLNIAYVSINTNICQNIPPKGRTRAGYKLNHPVVSLPVFRSELRIIYNPTLSCEYADSISSRYTELLFKENGIVDTKEVYLVARSNLEYNTINVEILCSNIDSIAGRSFSVLDPLLMTFMRKFKVTTMITQHVN